MENNKLNQQELNSLDLIKKRMTRNNEELMSAINTLNKQRHNSFKRDDLKLLSTTSVRNESVSTLSDLVCYDQFLLVGYQIQKIKTTILSDVFAAYSVNDGNIQSLSLSDSIFANKSFEEEFNKLYRFYKDAQFNQFIKEDDCIYVIFKFGSDYNDIKGFKWEKDRDGQYNYVGEQGFTHIVSLVDRCVNEWEPAENINKANKTVFIDQKSQIHFDEERATIEFIDENKKVLFSESLQEKLQTFDDISFEFATYSNLRLIKFKPYGENCRYYIFDPVNMKITRCDQLENNIVELPQKLGIAFGNGYYLTNGEFKLFGNNNEKLNYLKTIQSPNGEDFMLVFYNKADNSYSLFQFNLVDQSINSPVKTYGYAIGEQGNLLIIRSGTENSKDHAIQTWSSPFSSDLFYKQIHQNKEKDLLGTIGNNELVKAISEIKNIVSFIETKDVTVEIYSNVIQMINAVLDKYHWLPMFEELNFVALLKDEKKTAELVLEEFKKVEELKLFAQNKLTKVKEKANDLFVRTRMRQGEISYMMSIMVEVKALTGEISALQGERYIEQIDVANLLKDSESAYKEVNSIIANLLNRDSTYKEFEEKIKKLKIDVETHNSYKELIDVNKEIEEVSSSISFLNEEIGNLNFEDTRILSEVLEKIAMLFSTVNQVRSIAKNKESKLALEEAYVEFGSQSKILEQTLENALMKSTTVEKTDEEYAKVLSLIQNLESRFSHIGDENFSNTIEEQKNDIVSAFAAHKKNLRNKLLGKIENLKKAVEVSLKTISNKADKTFSLNEISTLFLTDGVILRASKMIDEIASYGDITTAEELKGCINQLRKKAIKRVRDDNELFEDHGNILKLGSYKFAVNRKPFDVVLIKNNDKIYSHVETTKFYKEVQLTEEQKSAYDVWDYDVISESKELYRSEFLAYSILQDAREGKSGLSNSLIADAIHTGISQGKTISLLQIINDYSSKLFREGYIKGVHDLDAEKIIIALNDVYEKSTDVRFSTDEKMAALILCIEKNKLSHSSIDSKVQKGLELLRKINSNVLLDAARKEIKDTLKKLPYDIDLSLDVLEYMAEHITSTNYCSKEVHLIYTEIKSILGDFINDFKNEIKRDTEPFMVVAELRALFTDYCSFYKISPSIVEELLICFLRQDVLNQKLEVKDFNYSITVSDLMGNHGLINEKGQLTLTVEDFNKRNKYHRENMLPRYDLVDKVRAQLLKSEREKINLNSMVAKPLVSFVKNKLISQSYMPKFGANFAKQIGETGKNKRVDTMGMLLLISPPGYGKTTLVEYIVDKLGMLFVKINCPSIGHDITSLDPAQANNLTARNEIEKINFAFEMGDNVCLYLDDIQHTNPEFLQKFISLCDGTRTVDGVWNGESKSYNLRGRRFSVVMAGNPYTENGEMFKIPDMLANRADTYNLGEISSDDKQVFELSYIENALTSNNVTASIMDRSANDIYLFLKQVDGIHVDNEEFDNEYSSAEAEEIRAVLKIMKRVQKTILKVNQQYIYSASQSDAYRTEPAFKLQGSYRNMAKITEKILPLMTDQEVDALVIDHYQSESQTLTSSNEENMLKFKEIFGNITEEELERWKFLKQEFLKAKNNSEQESIAASLQSIASSIESLISNKAQ